jgi:hypothetical protein
MKTLLFIDNVSPRHYSPLDLEHLGGTESAVCDVAEGLAEMRACNAIVEQGARSFDEMHKATYRPIGATKEKPQWVVVLRDPKALVDAPQSETSALGSKERRSGIELLCHKENLARNVTKLRWVNSGQFSQMG